MTKEYIQSVPLKTLHFNFKIKLKKMNEFEFEFAENLVKYFLFFFFKCFAFARKFHLKYNV